MGMPARRLDNKIDRVADKVDALKATYIKRQDEERDNAVQNQGEISERNIDARPHGPHHSCGGTRALRPDAPAAQ
jgi:hypothetical protein